MKKAKALFLIPSMVLPLYLASCSGSSKINLVFGDETISEMVDIKYQDFDSKIKNEETFMLAIEPTNPCSCWSDFKAISIDYIAKNKVIMYHMKYEMFYDNKTYGLDIRDGYTTFAIFENGELKQNIISDNQNMFHDAKTFNSYMENTVNLPHFFYVSLEKVKQLYAASEPSIIYFARSTCGDCKYVDTHFMKEYAQSRVDRKDLYILDCEKLGIRQYDEQGHLTPESEIAWNAFKAEMGLAESTNPDFGYGLGVVPTFLKVHSGKYDTASVYFNDTIAYENGKYIVKESFYSSSRVKNLEYLKQFNGTKVLEGLEINENDILKYGNYIMWDQKAAAKYHDPLLKQFFDYYL